MPRVSKVESEAIIVVLVPVLNSYVTRVSSR